MSTGKHDRIVVLVDMDCFYCQVEEQLNPELRGKPIAVVQYNAWQGGGIIAVNYPARERGVTRHMRGDEAAEHCPEIALVRVPNVREKADLSKYRDAGREVALVLQTFTPLLERASVDEAYLDITQNVIARLKDMDQGSFTVKPDMLVSTYALGYENIGKFVQTVAARLKANNGPSDADHFEDPRNNDVKLLIGATIVNEIRAAVKAKTGYECSAGIAHNKILAKLVCGINKPNKQTLLPISHVDHLYGTMSVRKLTGLGGKFGEEVCSTLQITKMSELDQFSLEELQRRFDEKNGLWLYNLSRGIDLEPVTPKFTSKSIGCCKKFPGRNSIKGIATLQHWLSELGQEIVERIAKDESENQRRPRQMVVSYAQDLSGTDVNSTRSVPLTQVDDVERIAADALDVIRRNTATFLRAGQPSVLNDPILFLGITVTKFEDLDKGGGERNSILTMFSKQTKQKALMAAAKLGGEEPSNVIETDQSVDGNLKEGRSEQNSINSMFSRQEKQLKAATFNEPEVVSNTNNIATIEDNQPSSSSSCVNEEPTRPASKIPFFAKKSKPTKSPETEKEMKFSDDSDEQVFHSYQTPITDNSNGIPSNNTDVYLNDTLEEPRPTRPASAEPPPPPPADTYKETYAEFQLPTPSKVPTERCAQCNRKVPLPELQSHADAHFAFQLSQEQRTEFRQNLAKTFVARQPSAKKPRLGSGSSGTPNTPSFSSQPTQTTLLHKFLVVKPDHTQQIVDAEDDNDSEVAKEPCPECGRMIRIDDQLEHADYHTAKRLQMEWNGQQRTMQQQRIEVGTAAGSGLGSAKKAKSTLASFFKKGTT